MPYVDSNKKLSDPRKVGRLFYILSPLLPNKVEIKRGKFKENDLETVLSNSLKKSRDKRITGSVEGYRIYHEILVDKLALLGKRNVILVTGTTPDMGERPFHLGIDPFYQGARLWDEILKTVNVVDKELKEKYNIEAKSLENYTFIPVAPIVYPINVSRDNENLKLVHAFPEIFDEVNERFSGRKHVPKIKLERTLDQEGGKGNWEFSTSLFDSHLAKFRYILPNYEAKLQKKISDLIEKSTYLNRQLLMNAYVTVFDKTGLNKIPVFAKKTSYVNNVFGLLPSEYKKILDNFGGVMRNAELTSLAECDPSALNVLKGKIWYDVIKNET